MKRTFLAISVHAPWPYTYPQGRLIDAEHRHCTIAFLGNMEEDQLPSFLEDLPLPSFPTTPAASATSIEFLPRRTPRVASLSLTLHSEISGFGEYLEKLHPYLAEKEFSVDKRPSHPHVSIARSPFKQTEWEEWFSPLPILFTGLHLYESVGNLTYHPIWSTPLLTPYEEIHHTADVAFLVRGKSFHDLHIHAALALAFCHPPLLRLIPKETASDLHAIIRSLNEAITTCDMEEGCGLKAVSYHGETTPHPSGVMEWEMIIDV